MTKKTVSSSDVDMLRYLVHLERSSRGHQSGGTCILCELINADLNNVESMKRVLRLAGRDV